MEWIKDKPPLEKEKSNKQISKQIDQNAKATTNLLEKVWKYCVVSVQYQGSIDVQLKLQGNFELKLFWDYFCIG